MRKILLFAQFGTFTHFLTLKVLCFDMRKNPQKLRNSVEPTPPLPLWTMSKVYIYHGMASLNRILQSNIVHILPCKKNIKCTRILKSIKYLVLW